MLARFDEAAVLATTASGRMLDLTGTEAGDEILGQMAATAGRHEDAAIHLRRYCDAAETRGERGFLATLAPALGRSLCALGRYEEAAPLAELGRELSDERDPSAAALWRQVQALVDANNGDYPTAEKLAREAVEIADRSDGLNLQGDALSDLAQVLHGAGRTDEAQQTLTEALDRYERKRNLARATSVRDQLIAFTR
jgi:tetratricopeptide (TPR) repeat protein